MKLFKKTILGLSIALFAIQPAQAGIVSEISNFAKKHNIITSILTGLTAGIATYNIFPDIEQKIPVNYKTINPLYAEWLKNGEKFNNINSLISLFSYLHYLVDLRPNQYIYSGRFEFANKLYFRKFPRIMTELSIISVMLITYLYLEKSKKDDKGQV